MLAAQGEEYSGRLEGSGFIVDACFICIILSLFPSKNCP